MSTGTTGISRKRVVEEAIELTTKVVNLKDRDGISFTAIAAILTKEYGKPILVSRIQRRYYKYIKRKRDGTPQQQTSNEPIGTEPYHHADINEVPPLERQFAKKVIEGQPRTDAARSLGVANPSHWQHQVFKRSAFQQYFRQLLEANGLTEGYIAKIHREQLDAKRTIYAVKDGKITDTMEVPDNSARGNAVKAGWELYKRIGSNQVEEQEESVSASIIVITGDQRKAIEGLIGGPLDCEIADDAANFAAAAGAVGTKQTENSADEPAPSQSSSGDAKPEDPPDE